MGYQGNQSPGKFLGFPNSLYRDVIKDPKNFQCLGSLGNLYGLGFPACRPPKVANFSMVDVWRMDRNRANKSRVSRTFGFNASGVRGHKTVHPNPH